MADFSVPVRSPDSVRAPVGRATRDFSRSSHYRSIDQSIREFDSLPYSALVRLPVVLAITSCTAPTIYRWIKAGLFPAPIKMGPSASAWEVGELREWLDKAKADRPLDPSSFDPSDLQPESPQFESA